MRRKPLTPVARFVFVGIPLLLASAVLSPATAAVIAWIVFSVGALVWLLVQWPRVRRRA